MATDAIKTGGYVVARGDNPTFVPGRRDFLQYAELGVTEASGGRVRAQRMIARGADTRPTGWHVHVCEGQFLYMLSGWVDLAMSDGTVVHLEPGDSMYVPGNTPHNEVGMSEDFELIEVSIPADMGTEPCDAPEGWEG